MIHVIVVPTCRVYRICTLSAVWWVTSHMKYVTLTMPCVPHAIRLLLCKFWRRVQFCYHEAFEFPEESSQLCAVKAGSIFFHVQKVLHVWCFQNIPIKNHYIFGSSKGVIVSYVPQHSPQILCFHGNDLSFVKKAIINAQHLQLKYKLQTPGNL